MVTKSKPAAKPTGKQNKTGQKATSKKTAPKQARSLTDLYMQMQALSTAFVEQYNEAVLRYQELVARGYSPRIQERYDSFTKKRGAELLSEWLQLAVNFGETTQKLSRQYSDELFDNLERL